MTALVGETAPPTQRRGARRGLRPPPVRAWTITAAAAVAYLIASPYSPDLAAASYRSALFSEAGFLLWDDSWYGGHHLLAYSVLAPPLGALTGPRLLAALSMTAAAALFGTLLSGRVADRAARVARAWFAVGAAIGLLSSRVPFDLGLAIGLGALALAQRRRASAALVASALCALASPVAGAFLGLAFITWALVERSRAALGGAAAALVPIALLAVAFPEGGTQPFVPSAFYPALAGVLAVTFLLPPRLRMLRAGGALYALAMIAAYLVPSAVGGNADRLGALVAGPVAALALPAGGRLVGRTRMLALLAPALLYWQANAPVADFAASVSDPAVHASYYTPLLDELRALHVGYGGRPTRIEVVPTVDHWEARWVAPRVMLARGWERQLDRLRNPLFYEPRPPTAARYREWLHQQAVAYVALPDAPLDYSAHGEARLLGGEGAGRPSPLAGAVREIWRSRHWRLFAVSDPRPLADPPAALDAVGRDSFAVAVPGPGSYTIRLRFTPYWALVAGRGCVSRSDGGWTEVQARESGRLRVRVEFSLDRVFERGARCR